MSLVGRTRATCGALLMEVVTGCSCADMPRGLHAGSMRAVSITEKYMYLGAGAIALTTTMCGALQMDSTGYSSRTELRGRHACFMLWSASRDSYICCKCVALYHEMCHLSFDQWCVICTVAAVMGRLICPTYGHLRTTARHGCSSLRVLLGRVDKVTV